MFTDEEKNRPQPARASSAFYDIAEGEVAVPPSTTYGSYRNNAGNISSTNVTDSTAAIVTSDVPDDTSGEEYVSDREMQFIATAFKEHNRSYPYTEEGNQGKQGVVNPVNKRKRIMEDIEDDGLTLEENFNELHSLDDRIDELASQIGEIQCAKLRLIAIMRKKMADLTDIDAEFKKRWRWHKAHPSTTSSAIPVQEPITPRSDPIDIQAPGATIAYKYATDIRNRLAISHEVFEKASKRLDFDSLK